jgi:hypothetical protein
MLSSGFMGSELVFAEDIIATQQQLSIPENIVRNFYKFYIDSLIQGIVPLKDRKPQLEQFVTARLIGKLAKKMESSEGLRSDYFIQAQDYDDEWGDRITVNIKSQQKAKVVLDVILDGKQIPKHRLEVTLITVGGNWKIDGVIGHHK